MNKLDNTNYMTTLFNTRNLFFGLLIVLVCTACFRAKPLNPITEGPKWQRVESVRLEDPIQNLIGTPFEVYAITENHFARISRQDTLLELRPFQDSDGAIARPVLDDNFFVRYTLDTGKDVIEFHSTRNPGIQHRIIADDLKNPTDNKVEIDREARLNGAFNDTETQFVLLTIVNFHYVAFYFDIEPSVDYNQILSLTPTHRIDLMDVEEGEDQLQVVRFIDGNYYVGTKNGAYRLTQDGNGERPSNVGDLGRWIVDFFKKDNRIIATGFNSFDQHTSLDNGLSWVRLNEESELQEIEMVGDTVFSQRALGFPWMLVKDNLLEVEDIVYSNEIDTGEGSNNSFYGIGYSNGKFYINFEKEIFFIESISPVEEE